MNQLFNQFSQRARDLLHREKPFLVLIVLTVAAITAQEFSRSARPTTCMPTAHVKHFRSLAPTFFQQWRERFIAIVSESDAQGLVRGIFLGEDSMISQETQKEFKRAGLYHLLAASGFNCWIVAFLFTLAGRIALRTLLRFLPALWMVRIKLFITPASMLTGAWLFWLWTDQSPPITRAALMITAKTVLELFQLRAPFSRLLWVQYLFSLTIAPKLWHNASFQLTYGCLFGILYFPRARFSTGWAQALSNYVSVNLGAALGAFPTTWIFFGEVNFMGIFTNWFASPFVSVGVMPAALLQMIACVPLWKQSPTFFTLNLLSSRSAAALHSAVRLALSAKSAIFDLLSF